MTVNHESYLLSTNDHEDMEEWVQAIHRIILSPFGGGKTFKSVCSSKSFLFCFSFVFTSPANAILFSDNSDQVSLLPTFWTLLNLTLNFLSSLFHLGGCYCLVHKVESFAHILESYNLMIDILMRCRNPFNTWIITEII